jgi:hypothetical protein
MKGTDEEAVGYMEEGVGLTRRQWEMYQKKWDR